LANCKKNALQRKAGPHHRGGGQIRIPVLTKEIFKKREMISREYLRSEASKKAKKNSEAAEGRKYGKKKNTRRDSFRENR